MDAAVELKIIPRRYERIFRREKEIRMVDLEDEMIPLDMKDIAIIRAFPTYDCEKTVLNVGCGPARIDFHLVTMGYRVFATDIEKYDTWEGKKNLVFYRSNIFDLTSFPVKNAPIVICSQVLEHLKGYKIALSNLLALTTTRLIITIPYQCAFDHPEHCNYWSDKATERFKDVKEFAELCKPYKTALSKIITKPQDVGKQFAYLIVVDKRQDGDN